MSQVSILSSAPPLRMILPKQTLFISSSQPVPVQSSNSWKCQNCPRRFKTERGQKQHQNKCAASGANNVIKVENLPDVTFVYDSLPVVISSVAIPVSQTQLSPTNRERSSAIGNEDAVDQVTTVNEGAINTNCQRGSHLIR